MHKGGLVYIRDGSINVPDYLLKSINIYDDSSLTGIYYPTPQKYIDNKEVKKENKSHDFVFTPINFYSWPFLLRLNIRIREELGAISKISFILNKIGINVLSADCHKVGHRYLLWSIIGEVSQIKENYDNRQYSWDRCKENKEFDAYDNYAPKDKFLRLENLINDEVGKFIDGDKKQKPLLTRIIEAGETSLFKFPNAKENEYPIQIVQAKTLPFHFWELHKERFLQKKEKENVKKSLNKIEQELSQISKIPQNLPRIEKLKKEEKALKEKALQLKIIRNPFKVNVNNRNLIFDESIPTEVLKAAGISSNGISTFGFANIHTSALRLRVSIIDKKEIEYYKRIIINYETHGLGRTSKGFVSNITEILKIENINIYNIANRIWKTEKLFEKGTIEFIVKLPIEEYYEKAKGDPSTSKSKLLKSRLNLQGASVDVCSINPYRIFISIISNFFFRDQFLSLCQEVGRDIGLLEDSFVLVKDNTNSTTIAVADAMKKSDGVLQFYIDFAKTKPKFSHWLDAEYFAAVALGLPIVRIKEATYNVEPVIDRDILALDLNMSNSKETIKKVVKEALEKLIIKMQEKRKTLF